MISERVVGVGRAGPARPGAMWRPRLTATPAVAGRTRVIEAVNKSVLAQLMLAMGCVAFAALLYMAQASQISVQQINISLLQSERAQVMTDNTNLHTTATSLSAVKRIESVAVGQLHMAEPSLSSTVWIKPVFPRIHAAPLLSESTLTAERRSEPLAWMTRFVTFVRFSL